MKLTPYWWDDLPPFAAGDAAPPVRADVVVIGSGYTGLNAALQTARGGRHTVVLDAADIGWGCSTRNGGQISFSVKGSYAELAERHGPAKAEAIVREGHNSLAWAKDFVASEGIACELRESGRFHAAHSSAAYEALAAKVHAVPAHLAQEAYLIPRAEQRAELGTDAYYGGVLYPKHLSVHPGLFHRGMLRLAQEAGVALVPHCAAKGIERDGSGLVVHHASGQTVARDVVVATNGYTGALTPWLRRRVIPIGSSIIATEPIAPEVMARLMPCGRVISDSRKVVYYYRLSPDGTRIVFGGRVAATDAGPEKAGARLLAEVVRLFPELRGIGISHSWGGYVAYTFDELMHTGTHEGVHYAMGYCGSGVGMAGYLGTRLGQKVLGMAEGRTAFDDLPFPTRPYYFGTPWFVAPAIVYYRWADRRSG